MKKALKFAVELMVFIFLLTLLVRYNVSTFFPYPIVGVTFYLLISIFLLSVGILQIKKEKPVGFFGPPKKKEFLSDTKAWNRMHGIIWIVYGVTIIVSYTVCAFVGNIFSAVIFVGVSVGALPIMSLYHSHLEKKYIR